MEKYRLHKAPRLSALHNIDTWNKLEEFLTRNGSASMENLIRVCRNHDHPNGGKGFVNYCIKNDWLIKSSAPTVVNSTCIFCDTDIARTTTANKLAYATYDLYPVTKLHTLIAPKRHAETYFDLTGQERDACYQLLEHSKKTIENLDVSVTGFNIGINNGESAGQTIFHCHIHLIPRRSGDTDFPRGGVRCVIPNKQNY